MIPVLLTDADYAAGREGFGRLVDAGSCVVNQTLNGVYELNMEYPVTGVLADKILPDRLILASDAGKDPQLFRIVRVAVSFAATLQVYAQHVTYELAYYFTKLPTEDTTLLLASAVTAANCAYPYSVFVPEIYQYQWPPSDGRFGMISCDAAIASRRVALTGADDLISVQQHLLNICEAAGVMLYCDNFTVTVKALPSVTNIPPRRLAYGHNITGMNMNRSLEGIVTHTWSYYYAPDVSSRIVTGELEATELADIAAFRRVEPINVKGNFPNATEPPAEDKVVDKGEERAPVLDPLALLPMDIQVELLASDEAATSLALGHPVRLIHNALSIEELTRVTETTWDVLHGRLTGVTLGTPHPNAAVDIAEMGSAMGGAVSKHKL